jgi:hypothetical protein
MSRTLLCIFFVFIHSQGTAQNGFIVVKKKNKTIRYFAKDSHITFQLHDGQWLTGIITKVLPDSFYLTRQIIRYYTIGTDTLRYKGLAFALKDIQALPSKRMQFVYDHDQVRIVMGRERFVWIRNGSIFKLGGAGYFGLNVVNDLYRKEPPFTSKKLPELGIAVAMFVFGEFLQQRFDPYLRIGKKYRLEAFVF